MINKPQTLDTLFNPSSIAVVGASEGKVGGMFLKSLIDKNFKGELFPVNPGKARVLGLKAYPTVRDIPFDVGVVITSIPAKATPQVIADCAAKKVKFVVMFTAGFREMGAEGLELEAKLLEVARSDGVRIVGPNCMGLYSPGSGIDTMVMRADLPHEKGDIAFLGQSGWSCENMVIAGSDRGLRFSNVVSIGNQADLTASDYLDYFGDDPQTKVIGAYLEGISDGRRLMELARRITREKPVIIWKAGRTSSGARSAISHTGAMAGSDIIWDAALKQAGVIRAYGHDDLIDFATAFSSPYLPSGNRLGVIGDSGGGGIVIADAAEGLGLEIPEFPLEVQLELEETLREVVPMIPNVKNPVDMPPPRRADYGLAVSRCLEIMARAVDTVLFFTYHTLADEPFINYIKEARDKIKKPVMVMPLYPSRNTAGLSLYTRQGIPAFPTPERAARAIRAFRQYALEMSAKS